MHIADLFTGFNSTAFRLEGLPLYNVPEESSAIEVFRRSGILPDDANSDWAALIAQSISVGKSFKRLRLLSAIPTEYELFELEVYKIGVRAGEEIRVAQRDEYPFDQDFWFFDNRWIARMHYDGGGAWLGAEVTEAREADRVMLGSWMSVFDKSPLLGDLTPL
ncbi:MAG: DUF6879 family protein [Rhodoglobus sp.]